MKQATLNVKKQTKAVSAAAKNATVESVSKEKEAIKIEQTLIEIAAEEENEKKAAEKKATAKKNTAVKTEVKKEEEKAEKAEVKPEVFVQFNYNEIKMETIIEKVKNAYASEGNKVSEDDTYRIYVKPEENMIYYVVNNSFASGTVLY